MELKKVITAEEYLELKRKAESKNELINGEIYATVESTRKHNRIALNMRVF